MWFQRWSVFLCFVSFFHLCLISFSSCIDQQILELFSRLTSNVSDVLSAQVPVRLNEVAAKLSDPEKFLSLSAEDGLEYLYKNSKEFNDFLAEFGHRGYKEFDTYQLQWEQNPLPLVHSLRALLSDSNSALKQPKTDEETETKELDFGEMGYISRKFLQKFIIPRVHKGIRGREMSKNYSIRVINQLRKGFYSLGECFVNEGKLPQKELVFFLLAEEMFEMIEDKSNPVIVLNARNRLRLHEKKEKFRFDLSAIGTDLAPIDEQSYLSKRFTRQRRDGAGEENNNEDDGGNENAVRLTGVPISSGKIIGRCLVAHSFEDAKLIQVSLHLFFYFVSALFFFGF